MSFKDDFRNEIFELQEEICRALEELEPEAKFREDQWDRPGGGGGRSRVISNGKLFEKGGVNCSEVFGDLPEVIKSEVPASAVKFYATGISLVIHPKSPMIPTTHANYRYFEVSDEKGKVVDRWFGGGADLTPYYLFEKDALHFHQMHKEACESVSPDFYPAFKRECDEYFFNRHRNERRGIGGVFYDHLRPDEHFSLEALHRFSRATQNAFLKAYVPIVKRNMEKSYGASEREWQEIRRGRYVEFNLIHDRGTLFGLKTGGRTESILMSLPPVVRWEYDHHPAEGSAEAKLIEVLENPVDWIN